MANVGNLLTYIANFETIAGLTDQVAGIRDFFGGRNPSDEVSPSDLQEIATMLRAIKNFADSQQEHTRSLNMIRQASGGSATPVPELPVGTDISGPSEVQEGGSDDPTDPPGATQEIRDAKKALSEKVGLVAQLIQKDVTNGGRYIKEAIARLAAASQELMGNTFLNEEEAIGDNLKTLKETIVKLKEYKEKLKLEEIIKIIRSDVASEGAMYLSRDIENISGDVSDFLTRNYDEKSNAIVTERCQKKLTPSRQN